MSGHPSEERLNDYLDRLLDRRDGRRIEEHLEACADCRRRLDRLREIVERTRGLPKAIAPRRDLWEGVEEAIGPVRTPGQIAPGSAAPGPWSRRSFLAVAAALLVAVTATATILLVEGTRETRAPVETETGPPSVAVPAAAGRAFAATEAEHLRTTARMLELLEDRREGLAPETREAIDASLRDIDAAIQRLREALAADPASAELIHMLDEAYRWKIDVLRRAIRAART